MKTEIKIGKRQLKKVSERYMCGLRDGNGKFNWELGALEGVLKDLGLFEIVIDYCKKNYTDYEEVIGKY